MTLSGNTATMYLNGEAVASSTDFTKRPSDLGYTTNNYLGRGQFDFDPKLKGAIDEFKIYNRALSAEEVAEAMKIKQVISFDPLEEKIIGDPGFAVKAYASSDLPVYFTSSDSLVAKVVGDTVYITGIGNADIIAHQDGDSLYRAAEPVAQTFTVLPLDLKVLHKDGDNGNTSNNSVKPHLQIENNDTIGVAYSEISVRYWFTAENYAGINTWIDHAQFGSDKVSMNYVSLPAPHEGAYGYIEYGFDASLGDLLPGAGSGPIHSRFANADWSGLDETDDYSFQSSSSYTLNEQITLYRNGLLVWGTEPEAVTPELNVKVYSENKNANTSTSTIHTFLKLNNEGNVPVDYKDLSIRYWFTKDSDSDLSYWIDYAELGRPNLSGQFVTLDPLVSGADTYFEISIDSAVGSLYPLSNTGEIQFRLTKSDWSKFSELDDHSYMPKAPYAANDHITVYYQGALVYGTEPGNTAGTGNVNSAEAASQGELQIVFYPNPTEGMLHYKANFIEGKEAALSVINDKGKVMIVKQINSNEGSVDMSSFKSGIYVVQVFDGDNLVRQKIIKK